MGRYVYGTNDFTYKYKVGAQSSNLDRLEAWSGVGRNEETSTFKTQLFLPYKEAHEDSMAFITGVSNLMCVYETVIPPQALGTDLQPNFEEAIYQIGEDWQRIVRAIDETLEGPAINPDLCIARSYSFTRDDWSALATKVGHGADASDVESLKRARDVVWKTGEDEYLPLLAVNALIHTVEHDLDSFQMVDGDEGRTNLWDVVEDYAGPYDPEKPWEDRAVHARMFSFQYERQAEAIELLQKLVSERPTAITTVQALVGLYIRRQDWTAVFELTNSLLEADQPDASRAVLLSLRGEAHWNAERLDEARSDAEACAALGRPELLDALTSQPA